MSSISSVAAGAGVPIITNTSDNSTAGKPGQTVEPAGSASSSVPLLYYTSPRIFVDPQYGQVVYDFRDPKTGATTQQVPSRQAIDAYNRSPQTSPVTGTVNSSNTVATGSTTPAPSQQNAAPAVSPAVAPGASSAPGTSTVV